MKKIQIRRIPNLNAYIVHISIYIHVDYVNNNFCSTLYVYITTIHSLFYIYIIII